jgi:hypothetical protein
MVWPAWYGDIPTWITTIAVAFAAGQFFVDRKRRAAEENREAKAQATQLTSWAVTDADGQPRVYGIVISNTSGSTFHDVVIDARMHDKPTPRPVELAILPPGDYFIRYNGTDEQYTWSFAVAVDSYNGWLRPYMKSPKYMVRGIAFSDNLNQRWTTNEHAVLSRERRESV